MQRVLSTLLLACALPAAAAEFATLGALSQGQFLRLSHDLGAALSYKGLTPATPLGPAGFDVGLEVSATDIRNADLFGLAGNRAPGYLVVPKLHLSKGLPFGVDVGTFVGGTSNPGATVYGLNARYALLADGLAMPAVALRVSGTRTSDIGGLRIATLAGDILVSKKLTIATPYVGAGVVHTKSEARVDGLADEDFRKSRVFAGLNLNFVILNVAFEAEKLGNTTTLSAKTGWRF